MSVGTRLFWHKRLFDIESTEGLFLRAITENVLHHQAKCLQYAEILKSRGFSPDMLKSPEDLHKIPPLPTLYLKRHSLFSVNEKKLMFKSTTSGTSGKVSSMGFDWTSSFRGLGMVWRTFSSNRLLSLRPTNYIVLGYQPAKRNKIGAVKTAYATTYAAPALHREFALRDTGSEYALNLDGIRHALIRYEKQGHPVRMMGFPAYFMFLLKGLRDHGIKVKLHHKSLIMLAGGWKQFFTERIEKPELYALSEEVLGVGESRIREFFGAVEHPICYFDCPNHRFHVPIYSRVIIRDPFTLEPIGLGSPGLLNLLTPMVTSMPYTSVMTDDLAALHPGEECGCGIKSPFIELFGRVGMADIKTCAAGAAELLTDTLKGAGS